MDGILSIAANLIEVGMFLFLVIHYFKKNPQIAKKCFVNPAKTLFRLCWLNKKDFITLNIGMVSVNPILKKVQEVGHDRLLEKNELFGVFERCGHCVPRLFRQSTLRKSTSSPIFGEGSPEVREVIPGSYKRVTIVPESYDLDIEVLYNH